MQRKNEAAAARARRAADSAVSAHAVAVLAVTEAHLFADRFGHSAADRANELAIADSTRGTIQAANQHIAQAAAAREVAALPQQALNGIGNDNAAQDAPAATQDGVSWSRLRPAGPTLADNAGPPLAPAENALEALAPALAPADVSAGDTSIAAPVGPTATAPDIVGPASSQQ